MQSVRNQNLRPKKIRFDKLPLHRACFEAHETQEIPERLLTKENACAKDVLKFTPLHVLAANPKATDDMIRCVAELHPDAMTDVANALGMSPLHFASINSGDNVRSFLPYLAKAQTQGQGKLICTFKNCNSKTPTALSIKHNPKEEIAQYLFGCQPCDTSPFEEQEHQDRVKELEQLYIKKIASLKQGDLGSFVEQHGWVRFVTEIEDETCISKIANFIQYSIFPVELVHELADAKDNEGRRAVEVAKEAIRNAFIERLYFMGRYDIKKGPPIHKSDTCIVVEAVDVKAEIYYEKIFDEQRNQEANINKVSFLEILNQRKLLQGFDDKKFEKTFKDYNEKGGGKISKNEFVNICKDIISHRKVAIKFMANKDQFLREIILRKENKEVVKRGAVVEICDIHDLDDVTEFKNSKESFKLPGAEEKEVYNFAIIMPFADRNLDIIYRSEKPSVTKVRNLIYLTANKMDIIHEQGLVHGDLKMQNIVRMGEDIIVVDMDASAKSANKGKNLKDDLIGGTDTSTKQFKVTKDIDATFFVGKKFSSGVLPPEMIYRLETKEEMKQFETYFQCLKEENDSQWKKIEPKMAGNNEFYVVKTFHTNFIEKEEEHVWSSPSSDSKRTKLVEFFKKGVLPYTPIEATEAIDLWSLGTILYTLCTNRSLFEMNTRTDDLADGKAMSELYHWDNKKRDDKLNRTKFDDHAAKELLRKLLSKNPDDRGTISKLLDDPMCKGGSDLTTIKDMFEKQKKEVKDILVDGKVDIAKAISEQTKALYTAIYDATEVGTPTTFILLNENLEKKNLTNPQRLENASNWIRELARLTKGIKDKKPEMVIDAIKNRMKKFIINKTLYLYLVDDLTGERVKADAFPISITKPYKTIPQLVPYLQCGMHSIVLYNGIAGILRVFGVQLPKIMSSETEKKLNESIALLKEANSAANYKAVHDQAESGSYGNSITVRGRSLRELHGFLEKEVGPEKMYAGLRRAYDKEGKAIWTLEPDGDKFDKLDKERIEMKNKLQKTQPVLSTK